MRTIILFVAALFLLAGASQAQVASPRFNPVITDSLVNPAAMMWSESSTVGGGYGTVDLEASGAGTIADGTAIFAQVRVVQDQFAVAGEFFSLDLDFVPAFGGGSFTSDTFGVGGHTSLGTRFPSAWGWKTRKTPSRADPRHPP